MKKLLFSIATILVLTGLVIYSDKPVGAQANPAEAGQALEIAPPVLTLRADPGETIKAQISLRDVSSSSLIVRGEVNDFVAEGEEGAPKLLLEEGETSPFSMKDWVEPLDQMNLKPKEIQNLTVTINVPADAAPGGYFGVIRFTATPPEIEQTGVSLSASLGTLVLLRVNGDAKEEMTIEDYYTAKEGKRGWLFDAKPVDFVVRMKNTGNVHEQPQGLITVKDIFGNPISTVNVNMPIRNVLPDSTRRFTQSINESNSGNRLLFGLYSADLEVKYGNDGKVLKKTIRFWVIPLGLIIAVIVGIILIFLVIRYLIRRNNQRIAEQARRRSRR